MVNSDALRTALEYEPATGVLRWRNNGKTAGTLDPAGYLYIKTKGRRFAAHRAIWLMVNGDVSLDGLVVDHINGDRSDNRIENLRIATTSQNAMNRVRLTRTSTSGHIGVTRNKKLNKWQSHVKVDGKKVHLGLFIDINEAVAAARGGREKYHKQFSTRIGAEA